MGKDIIVNFFCKWIKNICKIKSIIQIGNEDTLIVKDGRNEYEIKSSFMPNGESRFRVNCTNDGTAYIRTQTANDTEGWQNAHYHRALLETYIVQKGSVIFFEFKNNNPAFREYHAGEVFTTKNNVPHNVYMMKDSITHTVKHGESQPHPNKNADWWDDGEGCKQLNSLKEYSIEEILKKSPKNDEQSEQSSCKSNIIVIEKRVQYSKAYFHFDNLIWQFPVWILGLFTIGATMVGLSNKYLEDNYLDVNQDVPIGNVSFKISTIIFLLLFSFAIFGSILLYAIFRFRKHQMIEKKQIPIFKISPQLFIFAFSMILVFILFAVSSDFGFLRFTKLGYGTVIMTAIITTICLEFYLRYSAKKDKIKGNYDVS